MNKRIEKEIKFLEGRRKFLARSAAIFGAMGIAPAIKFELIEKLGKKMGMGSGELFANGALASEIASSFTIFIHGRAGVNLDTALTGQKSDMDIVRDPMACDPASPASRRASRHLPTEQIVLPGSKPGNDALLTPWASALAPIISGTTKLTNMASTYGVQVSTNHTNDFGIVRGGPQGMAAHPAAFLAGLAGDQTVYPGFFWRGNVGTTYRRGGAGDTDYPALQEVANAQAFLGNFSKVNLALTDAQINKVAEIASKFNKRFVADANVKDSDSLVSSAESGTRKLTINLRDALLPDNLPQSIKDKFGGDVPAAFKFGMMNLAGTNNGNINLQNALGESLYYFVRAMAEGGMKSGITAYNTGDWHGYYNGANNQLNADRAMRANSNSSRVGTYLAEVIAATYQMASMFPHPFKTDGSTVADHLSIVLCSEFVRGGYVNGCNDNPDQGRDGFIAFGRNWSQGVFGDVNLAAGQQMGFDPQNGVAGGRMVTPEEAYRTIALSVGIPSSKIDDYLTSTSLASVMLKS